MGIPLRLLGAFGWSEKVNRSSIESLLLKNKNVASHPQLATALIEYAALVDGGLVPDAAVIQVIKTLAPTSSTALASLSVLKTSLHSAGITNEIPTAPANNFVVMNEDTPSAAIAIGARDADGDALNYGLKTGATPQKGAVEFVNGRFIYTPTLNANGADSFALLVSDGKGGFAEQAVTVTIIPVNDAPVATNDGNGADAVVEANHLSAGDPTASGNVLTNDTDPDIGDSKTVTTVGTLAGRYGNLNLQANGEWVYTLNNINDLTDAIPQGETGLDTFNYTLRDAAGAASSAALTITVTGANDRPSATSSGTVSDEDATLPLQLTGLDFDGDVVNFRLEAISTEVKLYRDAGLKKELRIGDLVSPTTTNGESQSVPVFVRPNPNYNGLGSFSYVAIDNLGATSMMASVDINFRPINDAPEISASSGVALDLSSRPVQEVVRIDNLNVSGQAAITFQSWIKFDSSAAVNEYNDMIFGFFVYDISIVKSGTDTLIGVNTGNGDVYGARITNFANEWHHVTGIMTNGSATSFRLFIDGQELALSQIYSSPINSNATFSSTAYLGGWGINQFYGFNGAIDNVRIWAGARSEAQIRADMTAAVAGGEPGLLAAYDFETMSASPGGVVDRSGNGANGTLVNVSPSNTVSGPAIGAGDIVVTLVDAPGQSQVQKSGTVDYTDVDSADTHSVTFVASALNSLGGSFDLQQQAKPSGGGTVNWTYTVDQSLVAKLGAGETVSESFDIVVADNKGASDIQTVRVSVVGVNDAPLAVADNATTNEDTAVIITVLANDTDPDGDALTVLSATAPPGRGSVTLLGNAIVFDPGQNLQNLGAGQVENVVVQYIVKDALGATSQAQLSIQITGLNETAGDGKIDIFMTDYNRGGAFYSLDQTGSYTVGFDRYQGYAVTGHVGAATGDFDQDGALDIVVGTTGENLLLKNDGTGQFGATPLPGIATGTQNVIVADMDTDGDPDIIIANRGAPNQILVNDGSGHFTAIDLPGGSRDTLDLAAGDLDGDADIDLYVANWSGQSSQILLNQGNLQFTASDAPATGGYALGVALGDLNGDGSLDVVVSNDFSASQVFFNDGNGNLSLSSGLPRGGFSWDVALADLDGDGDLDGMIANRYGLNQLLLNDGDGNFTVSSLPSVGGDNLTNSITLGDVDQDGDIDAFATTYFSAGGIYINDGSARFTYLEMPSYSDKLGFKAVIGDFF